MNIYTVRDNLKNTIAGKKMIKPSYPVIRSPLRFSCNNRFLTMASINLLRL